MGENVDAGLRLVDRHAGCSRDVWRRRERQMGRHPGDTQEGKFDPFERQHWGRVCPPYGDRGGERCAIFAWEGVQAHPHDLSDFRYENIWKQNVNFQHGSDLITIAASIRLINFSQIK